MGIERIAPGSAIVAVSAGSRRSLVFGLTWFALVGSHIAPMARARARQLNATHYVAGGLRAASGGCIRLARRAGRGELHAAAQAYAHLYPDGAVGSVVELPDGRYWTVAAQDGAVMSRGDRIHPDGAAAEQAMAELRMLRPALRLIDGGQVLARLEQTLDSASRLLPVASRWGRLPWLLCGSVAGLALALALPQAWDYARKRADGPAPSTGQDGQAWQTAFEAWRAGVRVHTPEDLRRLMGSLHRVPLSLRGWNLQRVSCAPEGAGWSCAAHYGRALPQATHDALAAAAPAGWRTEFESLERSALRWQVPGDGATLASAPLPRRPARRFIDSLQRVSSAFSELRLGPAAPVPLPAPRGAQGEPLAMPSDLPGLGTRSLSITGPLRSFGVLALRDTVAAWTSFTLHVDAGRPSALAGSVLRAQLQGTLYELR